MAVWGLLRGVAASLGRRLLVALAVAGVVWGLVTAAQAQAVLGAARAELSARKEALFDQMLRDPSNLDVAFAYADVAARLGDNEAAVSTLERMLLFNPNLPRVDLELGTLYFRMGSFEISRGYFEKALAGNPPPEVRGRVEQYLSQIVVQQSPQQVHGYAMVGMQYQSDANVAPGSSVIQSPFGFAVTLGRQFVKRDDGNIFATASALYSYDLGTQTRDAVEVSGVGFVNHYFSVSRFDLDLGEATAGVRFNFPDPVPGLGIKSSSLKPYAIVNDVALGGNQYFNTYGVGLEQTLLLWDDLALRGSFEFRQKNFSDAPDRPTSRGLNGNDKYISILASKPLPVPFEGLGGASSELRLEFDFLDQDTRLAYYSNKGYGGSLGYHLRYDDPTGVVGLPWDTTLFVSRSWNNYAAPDPCCNTSNNPLAPGISERFDRRWRFGLTQIFQVADNLGVVVQLQRDIVSSNLSLYGYTSNSVLVGPQIRF
jgi:tetratricopeptide (TPR) repeat protein